MKRSALAVLAVLLGANVSYAGESALDALKGYSSAELNIPQARAEAIPAPTAVMLAEEQPVFVSVIKASSVSGKISNGGSEKKVTTCQVMRYEYKDRIDLVLQSDAYPYCFPFTVNKVLLPLDRKIVLGENTELDSYTFKPDLFGRNGQLISYLKRYYANSTFTPYSHEAKLKVSPDLGRVISAAVDMSDPYGADGGFSCDFSDSHSEAL